MSEKRDLFDLSAEIKGVALILSGLGNQLDNNATDTLTPDSLKDALFGVCVHLERISEDLGNLDRIEAGKKGVENEN